MRKGWSSFVIAITSARVQLEKRMQYSMIVNVQQRANVLTFRSCDYPGDFYLEMIRILISSRSPSNEVPFR